MAGYDHRCPYCNAVLDVRQVWDYQSEFSMDCKCGKKVSVTVESEPVFFTDKPKCKMCNKTEPTGRHYCQKCQDKLNELSKFNGGK
jgi:hypothetical protein